MLQFNGMAKSHAIIEQYSESESSIEDNPVPGPKSEIVIPLRAPQDQGKIKEKVYEQGDSISARLRGIPENLGGSFFRNNPNPQPPPRAGKVSKPSKPSKAGKSSKTKSTGGQVPTGVPLPSGVLPPVPHTAPVRVERKGVQGRPAQRSASEVKFRYSPTFENPQQYDWDRINLNPGNDH